MNRLSRLVEACNESPVWGNEWELPLNTVEAAYRHGPNVAVVRAEPGQKVLDVIFRPMLQDVEAVELGGHRREVTGNSVHIIAMSRAVDPTKPELVIEYRNGERRVWEPSPPDDTPRAAKF